MFLEPFVFVWDRKPSLFAVFMYKKRGFYVGIFSSLLLLLLAETEPSPEDGLAFLEERANVFLRLRFGALILSFFVGV